MAGFNEVGNFVARGAGHVDPRLVAILQAAATQVPYAVEAYSGYRPGDPRFHGRGLATDVRLVDNGRAIPNYQDAKSFSAYEKFAQAARAIQMAKYPDLANRFRWGGYFSGAPGKYGAADLMHFDLGGGGGLGMAGGSWTGGLTDAQRKLYPGAISTGLDTQPVGTTVPTSAADAMAATSATGGPAAGFKAPFGDLISPTAVGNSVMPDLPNIGLGFLAAAEDRKQREQDQQLIDQQRRAALFTPASGSTLAGLYG